MGLSGPIISLSHRHAVLQGATSDLQKAFGFGVSSSKSLVTEPQNVFPARMTTASVLDFHTRKHYDAYMPTPTTVSAQRLSFGSPFDNPFDH